MKGRSFDTFELTPGNREAHDVCRRMATMQDIGSSLVLLLGPEGSGKSHLLWSTAKQVRLAPMPVGLALVTPGDFPEKVKGLVEDPRPLQGRRAMLLVDNLEGFDLEARQLEAVIEVFLAHQHPVIVASNVQPNRLQKLSGPLRARLARSRSIILEARTAGEAPWQAAEQAAALEEANQALEREKNALQARFDTLQQERDGLLQRIGFLLQEKEMLQQHNESLHRERAAFQEQCQALLPERDWLKQKSESLERERTAFQDAITESNKVVAEKDAELAAFQKKLDEAIGDADYALANQVRTKAMLSVAQADLEGQEQLRATLQDREKALAKAEMCVGQAMSRIEEMRKAYAGWGEEIMADIAAMAGEMAAERPTPVGHEPPLLRALAAAGADQEQVRTALTATRERLKAIESEWEKTRRLLAIQAAEMDALRHTAASQVASAHIQAGEMERRIDTLEIAISEVDAAIMTASGALPEEGVGIATLRAALGHLQEQLQALRAARSGEEPKPDPIDEMTLFDADVETLPTDFQGHRPGGVRGLDVALISALEGARTPKSAATSDGGA